MADNPTSANSANSAGITGNRKLMRLVYGLRSTIVAKKAPEEEISAARDAKVSSLYFLKAFILGLPGHSCRAAFAISSKPRS